MSRTEEMLFYFHMILWISLFQLVVLTLNKIQHDFQEAVVWVVGVHTAGGASKTRQKPSLSSVWWYSGQLVPLSPHRRSWVQTQCVGGVRLIGVLKCKSMNVCISGCVSHTLLCDRLVTWRPSPYGSWDTRRIMDENSSVYVRKHWDQWILHITVYFCKISSAWILILCSCRLKWRVLIGG